MIKDLWHRRSSDSYIGWLRSKGVEIGEGCIFRGQRTARIDISRPEMVTIGNNVDMNMHFQVLTHDWGSHVFRGKYHDLVNSCAPVNIGSNIYFGTNVIVLKGITIGDNCIIGAGSIVTHDIPSNSVATGSPCRVVCSLRDYYEKRKRLGLAEAMERVRRIRKRYGRDPYPREMTEEFIYFVNKQNAKEYEEKGIPIRFQLADAYDDWMENHQPPFDSFEAFLHYVDMVCMGGGNSCIK